MGKYIKRLILIQEDEDGEIHSATTERHSIDLEYWPTDKEGIPVVVKPLQSDAETWSDWTYEALMYFWRENSKSD